MPKVPTVRPRSDRDSGREVPANAGATINPPSALPRRMAQSTATATDAATTPLTDAEWGELALPDDDPARSLYRVSALGDCLTALAYRGGGGEVADMPVKLQPRLDEGKECEPRILAMFHERFGYRAATFPELAALQVTHSIAGWNNEEGQVQVRLAVGKTVEIRGHTDEIATHARHDQDAAVAFYVVEAKAFGDSLWKVWKKDGLGGFPRYQWQVSGLMACTRMPLVMVVGHKDATGNDVSEIDVKVYAEPPFAEKEVKARVLRAQRYVNDEQLPPCEEGRWPCPVFFLDECMGKEPVARELLVDEVLGRLVRLHYSYGVDARDANRDRDAVKEQIDKHMAENGYARGQVYVVEDDAHNRFEYEWVQEDREGYTVAAGTRSYPRVKALK